MNQASQWLSCMLSVKLSFDDENVPLSHWLKDGMLSYVFVYNPADNSVSLNKVDSCCEMLKAFHEIIPQLYPETFCTANFHTLAHLCDCVQDWGPLWCYSTFGFENLNGCLHKYAHGTGNVLPQLVESFVIHQASNTATIPKENNDETIALIKHLNRNFNPEHVKKYTKSETESRRNGCSNN